MKKELTAPDRIVQIQWRHVSLGVDVHRLREVVETETEGFLA